MRQARVEYPGATLGGQGGHYPTPTVKGMSQGVVRKNTLWLGTDWGVSEPCKNCKNPGLVFMHFWPRYVQDIKNKPELNEQQVEVVSRKNNGNKSWESSI